jgi:hypothetical protein
MERMLCGCLLAVALLVPASANAGPRETATGIAADSVLAESGTCYGTLGNSGPNAGALIRINLATGAGTVIGPTGIVGQFGDPGVPALAIRSTGQMYAMDIGASSKLYLLNAKTGAATLVGATGLASPPAIVFDGHNVLNAIDAAGNLHTLNEATGAATLVGATGVAIKGLAVDPASGDLWGSDASSRIYKIDGATAAATLVGNTGLAPSPDLTFNQAGVLYAVSGGGLSANNLISINKSTGAGTVIGSIGFPSVSGMAIRLDNIVPTLLQTYASTWGEGRVEVRWRLIDVTGQLDFEIDRAEGGQGYRRMDAAGVFMDGVEFVYRDDSVEPGWTYRYRVVVLEDGARAVSFETAVTVPGAELSLTIAPNPVVRSATVRLHLPKPSPVALRIYDVDGRSVRTLLDERDFPAGQHDVVWDGRSHDGRRVGPGIYWSELTTPGFRTMRRIAVIR